MNYVLINEYESTLHNEHYLSSSENMAWKKFRSVQDLNPWPLWYLCSALPTELTSQLGAGCHVGISITGALCWSNPASNTSCHPLFSFKTGSSV